MSLKKKKRNNSIFEKKKKKKKKKKKYHCPITVDIYAYKFHTLKMTTIMKQDNNIFITKIIIVYLY